MLTKLIDSYKLATANVELNIRNYVLQQYLKFSKAAQTLADEEAQRKYAARTKEYRRKKELEFEDLQRSKDRVLSEMETRLVFLECLWKRAKVHMTEETANSTLKAAADDAGVGIHIGDDGVITVNSVGPIWEERDEADRVFRLMLVGDQPTQ